MKILHVVGARPNFVKLAAVYAACRWREMEQVIVHTGQHYDINMSDVFFQELELPTPDINLDVGSGSHAEQTAMVMLRLEKVVLTVRPNWVFVYGDVNSTVAAALVCAKLGFPTAHVEAGLRSFDRSMPEEINRVVTDQVANLLFTHSEDANVNLQREGITPDRIRYVGNTMIDTLIKLLPLAEQQDLSRFPGAYALVTLHRPTNVDQPEMFMRIATSLVRISDDLPIVFPVHPRTRRHTQILESLRKHPQVILTEPLGYLTFLALQRKATVVITDSGGIQEETTFLGVPCLTLRNSTERPVTVSLGTNILVGSDLAKLEQEVRNILNGKVKKGRVPPLWDGHAGERIAYAVLELGNSVSTGNSLSQASFSD